MFSGVVCTVASFFLLYAFQMKSIGYNVSDGSLFLETDTPRPDLKDGDVMIKVQSHCQLSLATPLQARVHNFVTIIA